MSGLSFSTPSALDLEIGGSYGSFSVGKSEGGTSTRVEYLLSDVGLQMSEGTDAKILRHLMPVRELFDIRTLDFEELMQRDIDDARVSNELIPYLLSDESADFVKLFPPIVVVVAPLETNALRPAKLYPEITKLRKEVEGNLCDVVRSGSVGEEAYQLHRPIHEGKVRNHDFVRLRLNTEKVGLVIVDGQHRAMALLALFRNMKSDWANATRTAFKDYYSQWPRELIESFDLENVSLPVMFCTFPELHEGTAPDFDVMKAARSVFLTLNKSARTVSTSRNRLLDDNDLLSSFLREVLSKVKQRSELSPYSLRIHGVELDQANNRTKISDPIALTGVNHIYQIIEHLFVGKPASDVDRTIFRRTRRRDRIDLGTYDEGMKRINAKNVLSADDLAATTRTSFGSEVEKQLKDLFQSKIGGKIELYYQRFKPFEVHSAASLALSKSLEAEGDQRVKPILFGGQSMLRTFESHYENIERKIAIQNRETLSAALKASQETLAGTKRLLDTKTAEFKLNRSYKFIVDVHDKSQLKIDGEIAPKVVGFINELYTNLFTTVAFQTACVGFFFDTISLNNDINYDDAAIAQEFDLYIEQLNQFFHPSSTAEVKRLIEVFKGKISGSPKDWNVTDKTASTFRQVVYRSEMQPDQWPRYKALLAELWHPKGETLKLSLEHERKRIRKQVLNQLISILTSEYSRSENKQLEDLSGAEIEKLRRKSAQNVAGYLKHILMDAYPDVDEVLSWADEAVEYDLEEAD